MAYATSKTTYYETPRIGHIREVQVSDVSGVLI